MQDKESQDDRDMQTDEDCPDFKTHDQNMTLLQNSDEENKPIDHNKEDTVNTCDILSYDDNESPDINVSDSIPYDVPNKVDDTEGEHTRLVEASEVALPSDDESSDKEPEVIMESVESTGE